MNGSSSYADLYKIHNPNDLLAHQHLKKYAQLVLLRNPLTQTALDIGCANGILLTELAQLGILATGVDIDLGQIRLCADKQLNAIHTVDTLSWLSNCPSQFDVIFLLDVLEHFPANDQILLLSLIKTHLSPKGQLIIKVPNPDFGLRLCNIDYTHRFCPTYDCLMATLTQLGFADISCQNEIPWSSPRSALSYLALHTKHFWHSLFYALATPLARGIRRLMYASEIGLEKAFRMPLTPNYLLLAQNTHENLNSQ